MSRWTNDYGDIPRWYWRSTAFQAPGIREYWARRRRGRAALAGILALVGGL